MKAVLGADEKGFWVRRAEGGSVYIDIFGVASLQAGTLEEILAVTIADRTPVYEGDEFTLVF